MRRKFIRFNCVDLMMAGLWNVSDCCPTCHSEWSGTSRGKRLGFPVGFEGSLCCKALARVVDRSTPMDWEAVRRAVIMRKELEGGRV